MLTPSDSDDDLWDSNDSLDPNDSQFWNDLQIIEDRAINAAALAPQLSSPDLGRTESSLSPTPPSTPTNSSPTNTPTDLLSPPAPRVGASYAAPRTPTRSTEAPFDIPSTPTPVRIREASSTRPAARRILLHLNDPANPFRLARIPGEETVSNQTPSTLSTSTQSSQHHPITPSTAEGRAIRMALIAAAFDEFENSIPPDAPTPARLGTPASTPARVRTTTNRHRAVTPSPAPAPVPQQSVASTSGIAEPLSSTQPSHSRAPAPSTPNHEDFPPPYADSISPSHVNLLGPNLIFNAPLNDRALQVLSATMGNGLMAGLSPTPLIWMELLRCLRCEENDYQQPLWPSVLRRCGIPADQLEDIIEAMNNARIVLST